MHCRCDFFRSWSLLALILASAVLTARATQLASSLCGTVVTESDAQQAAQAPTTEGHWTGAPERLRAVGSGALERRYQTGP
jgi:hypothetical protein